jgi:signal transduction histidine kinase
MDDDTTICIDDDMFKYLLDTILNNVYRHGFEEKEVVGAAVHISTTPTLIDEKPYLLLSIANNGKPFADDFSIEKFIGRGECCGDTKHTGLGGYHIYHIVKSHNGFLNITRTSAWPVIFEILIPITNSFEDENQLLSYENRANCI